MHCSLSSVKMVPLIAKTDTKRRILSNRNESHIVLLAGAGSSCHLGLPTLNDLLRQIIIGEDEIAARIRRTREAIEKQPTRFRPAVFEELIVRIKLYLETSYLLRTDHTFRHETAHLPLDLDNGTIERKWKQALSRCYRILLQEYGPGRIDISSKQFATTISILKALAQMNEGVLHVFTTNYDCSFQVIASHCPNATFFTHIDSTNGRFSDSWHLGNPNARPESGRFYIHRLHGCVGWFNISADNVHNAGGIVKEIYGAGSHLEITDDDFLDQMCIKLIATELVGTNPAFASAFDEFANQLRAADVLLIWGYSFSDLEVVRTINHIFAEREDPLRILYLDPFLPETTARDIVERTLLKAPIQPAAAFMPRRIPWTPPDGLDDLVPAIQRAINSQ